MVSAIAATRPLVGRYLRSGWAWVYPAFYWYHSVVRRVEGEPTVVIVEDAYRSWRWRAPYRPPWHMAKRDAELREAEVADA